MDTRTTAKLFHTLVVVGMGLAHAGCAGDDAPTNTGGSNEPAPAASSNQSATVASNTTDAGHVDAAAPTKTPTGGDTMPSWTCCA